MILYDRPACKCDLRCVGRYVWPLGIVQFDDDNCIVFEKMVVNVIVGCNGVQVDFENVLVAEWCSFCAVKILEAPL